MEADIYMYSSEVRIKGLINELQSAVFSLFISIDA